MTNPTSKGWKGMGQRAMRQPGHTLTWGEYINPSEKEIELTYGIPFSNLFQKTFWGLLKNQKLMD
ncbi:MAG: hypothetical protein CM15mP12_2640 [Gammaproteobacteria bacterium]|nr:MAG: hypothetical protein CM15mP12_2640 [Gammaproteobacteria bacterium]